MWSRVITFLTCDCEIPSVEKMCEVVATKNFVKSWLLQSLWMDWAEIWIRYRGCT